MFIDAGANYATIQSFPADPEGPGKVSPMGNDHSGSDDDNTNSSDTHNTSNHNMHTHYVYACICMCVYIYIYIYIIKAQGKSRPWGGRVTRSSCSAADEEAEEPWDAQKKDISNEK